jgi:hypothetical protein
LDAGLDAQLAKTEGVSMRLMETVQGRTEWPHDPGPAAAAPARLMQIHRERMAGRPAAHARSPSLKPTAMTAQPATPATPARKSCLDQETASTLFWSTI